MPARHLRHRLHPAAPGPLPVPRFTHHLVAGLDEPVRRYFTHAIRDGAALADRFRLTMDGRIRVGRLWLPFTAIQETGRESFTWEARVGVGPLRVLAVTDRYDDDGGLTDGRLFGRLPLFHGDDDDTTRSSIGRAALEACCFAAPALLPGSGVEWRAEGDDAIVAAWALGAERVTVHLTIDPAGRVRAVSTPRWGRVGVPRHQYIPCGGDVRADRRFGDFTVPSRMSVGWWYGTDRYAPFFIARLRDLHPMAVPGATAHASTDPTTPTARRTSR